MNALALDCALSRLTIAAKKDDCLVKVCYDIGIKQSQKLLPAIDFVMKELSLAPSELDYTALTLGPGSFTSLRLGLSALKALSLSDGIPVYGIPTLEAYAWALRNTFPTLVSVVESKESEYFYQIFTGTKKECEVENGKAQDIHAKLESFGNDVYVCGAGAERCAEELNATTECRNFQVITPQNDACESLFELAEKMISENKKPLEEYEGPLYCRKSEAELVYEKKQAEAK